jgi:hypothetical protein
MPEKLDDQLLASHRPFEFRDPSWSAVGIAAGCVGLTGTAPLTKVRFAPLIHAAPPLVEQFAMDAEFLRQR